ncbi:MULTISPECIES: DUF2790 domain-containing protein [Pseudomonas]|jgi:hypothetical protein|uniref:DUF2790 domain-containing protein n=1 Tax=Pseudomonas fluorescens TaxID=294 RepID=A0A5E6SYC1_PSEFL|nr:MULTISPECIES: DUF2790 domain-containing protein [Pseudomonas]MBV7525522.1 DUF2790 domain-containing protein [Pseudomonas sp. PDM29]PMZ91391.1 DUF2790 domain-containing protein [Pseudomonas sp. FW215-T2]PNA14607.1 DUF2790 domain-containing protein [Pseudomonas sp. FW215-R3]PNB38584.1 DUF2790 domain-containing protein [Pseudomonas sp. FW305-131]QHF39252.1 hypothetical protein PspS34_13675 [Pseudomonas sp. S34]
MSMATIVSAVISSLAPSVFDQNNLQEPGAHVSAVDYHYGMDIDVKQVLQRTDTSDKTGVVPVTVVYLDSQGELHKIRFLEWGASPASPTSIA